MVEWTYVDRPPAPEVGGSALVVCFGCGLLVRAEGHGTTDRPYLIEDHEPCKSTVREPGEGRRGP